MRIEILDIDQRRARLVAWGFAFIVAMGVWNLGTDLLRTITGFDRAAKIAKCNAWVKEGIEVETKYSSELGCIARRSDGWQQVY